ncbi:MAG: KamA family radical SAM protein [Bacteroidales bacterium]
MIISQQEKLLQSAKNLVISESTKKLIDQLFDENPRLKTLLDQSKTATHFQNLIEDWILEYLENNPLSKEFYEGKIHGFENLKRLEWKDYAAIRILDYISNSGREFEDLNLRGRKVVSEPFVLLYKAVKENTGGAHCNFVLDMIHLFRQFTGFEKRTLPSKEKIREWMGHHPDGLDQRIIEIRERNKRRIIDTLIQKIDNKEIKSKKFYFNPGLSYREKTAIVSKWWDDHTFHLRFAVRNPDLLNELLDNSLDEDTMKVLYKAQKSGIPFFVNPYYLSLLNVNAPDFAKGADLAIRYYVIYSSQLVDEFGNIVAWEKEDIVEPGKPNAAGWILPSNNNVHRRYPEVAILIPDTVGRACAGLCASCQRMYDFQRGNLNFDLEKLQPRESWDVKMKRIMKYWEEDTQLRDILITGGDALMSSDTSLKKILNAVYEMALRKIQSNKERKENEKYAEIVRVRLGTRLPVYLPQRITSSLVDILADFKQKATRAGIKQFVVQTHFQSPMEITPESRKGIEKIISAGWMVVNQLVFTAPASRRGHTAKLRKALNDMGVLPYYTFSVKGYMENSSKFATNARAAQEQFEEKTLGEIPKKFIDDIISFPDSAENMVKQIDHLREKADIPFLSTDRNVLNLPGVGKSMTYRVIGITKDGRRILEFDHDHTRNHSPVIDQLGKFVIIESKSIASYLEQLKEMGENKYDYASIWGYSISETENRPSVYEYPAYTFALTSQFSNYKE